MIIEMTNIEIIKDSWDSPDGRLVTRHYTLPPAREGHLLTLHHHHELHQTTNRVILSYHLKQCIEADYLRLGSPILLLDLEWLHLDSKAAPV